MPAAITDKFTEATSGSRPVPTSLTALRAVSASSISCAALTGWPTATAVHFIIYSVDVNGAKVAGSQTDWKGIVSGTTITDLVLKAGTDNGDSIGAIVEAAPTAAWADDLVEGVLVSLDQDGTLRAGAVDNAAAIANGIITPAKFTTALQGDWKVGILPAVSSVTENGNHSADIVFASTVASTLTPGMRLRTSRTVTAPTQCADLESGSSQYFNDTSVSGITFTDDFAAGGWVKLESYGNYGIIGRWNGTSGWALIVNTSGTIQLFGTNAGAGNSSYVLSQQSIPLNKWVHVAAQLDMSSFTASTTTSYIMIDGVDVPCTVARTGSNPTALVQAGDLSVGGYNSTNFMDGKLSNVFVSSTKVTQANIRAIMSRGLSTADTTTYSLASAYTLNNSITDLNTTSANNLTAQGGAAATNADSPFTQDSNGTPGGTYDYAVVTKVSTSTATVQYPEGCAIATSGGISAVDFSNSKAPIGMPIEKSKYLIQTILNSGSGAISIGAINQWTASPGAKITVPVGVWDISYNLAVTLDSSVSGTRNGTFGLFGSTTLPAVNAVYTQKSISWLYTGSLTGTTWAAQVTKTLDNIRLSSSETFTVNASIYSATGTETYSIRGDLGPCVLTAELGYL